MPEIRLHGPKYESLIHTRGRDVEWEEAVVCSCWNLDSGQPNYHCKACNGIGHIYKDPILDRVLIMSIAHSKEYAPMLGSFEYGDAVMTVPRHSALACDVQNNPVSWRLNKIFDVGMYDLITLTDDEYKTSEVLVSGTSMYKRPADTLYNRKVLSIREVQSVNPDTGEITYYTLGEDFTLNGNKINWVPEKNRPLIGEKYSVSYMHRPVYIVLSALPKPRHQDNQDLPKFVALRYRSSGAGAE